MKKIADTILLSKFWWIFLIILTVGCYYFATFIDVRMDLTAEKRYTLSKNAEELLQKLNDKIEISVLLTGDLPAGFKKLQNTTISFLERCKNIAGQQFSYRFITPDAFIADSIHFPLNDTLKIEFVKNAGVKQNETSKNATKAVFVYPVALIKYKDQYATVNLLQGQSNKGFLRPEGVDAQLQVINNAEALLEYQFMSAINALIRPASPIIAYATGHGEPMGPETYDLRSALDGKYRFFLYDLKKQPAVSDSVQVLIIDKPTEKFTDEDKLKIDQYVMRGGSVLFLLDILNAELDSLRVNGREFTAYNRSLDLEDLLFKYGVRINSDLVQDLQCDLLPQTVGMIGNKPQIEIMQWPYFPLLYPNTEHPIVKNMDAVVMQFPQSIDTVKTVEIKKSILLATSNTSAITGSPAIVTVEVLKNLEQPSAWKLKNIPLAVLCEGKFKSLFAGRISKMQIDTMKNYGIDFYSESRTPGKIIVTADGDWVLNAFNQQGPLQMGENMFTKYTFANRDFLLNSLDYLTDKTGIFQSRSKEYVLRMLDPKQIEKNKASWQWLNIGLPLMLVAVLGFIFQWRRKQQYGRS